MVPAPILASAPIARVADIGQVVDLGALLDRRLLDLAEIADLRLLVQVRARPQPRERADLAPVATDAPSMWLKAWIVAPDAIFTPGPNQTFGSTSVSGPISVSCEKNTVSGAISVTPDSIMARRRRRCQMASASASSARLLMPSTLSKLASVATTSRPAPCGDLDDVGQIIFALGVVVADLFEQRERMAAGDRHQAAIAEFDLLLGLGGVLLLADGDELAALLDQPAVAGRIGRAEADDDDSRALGELLPRGEQRARPRSAACRRTSPGCRHSRARSPRGRRAPHGAVPSRWSWTKISAPGRDARQPCGPPRRRGRRPARDRVPPAARAAAATCATIGRPAISCSTFGLALFMRVPSPAARMIDRQVLEVMAVFREIGGRIRRSSSTAAIRLQSWRILGRILPSSRKTPPVSE